MRSEEYERAAELIAQLMRDPSARASFRRAPAEVCRAHGLDDVAAELTGREGALQILDVRESRSSVAGVLIAAAAEGMAFFAFVEEAHASGGGGGALSPDVAHVVALTRSQLPAVAPDGNGGGEAHVDVATAAEPQPAGTVDPPATGAATIEPPAPEAGGQATPAEIVPQAAPATPDLLHDPRLSLTDSAAQGLASSGPASRTSEILTALLTHHTVSVGAVAPDGSFTITMVDGAPVGQANIAARDLAQELDALDESLRPTAVGTPWPIDGQGREFYTDDAHQHHIEVGFGDPPPKPPAVQAAGDPPPAAPAAEPPPAAPDPAPASPAGAPSQAASATPAGGTGGFAALSGTAGPAGGGTIRVGAVASDPPPGAATPADAAPAGAAQPSGVAADAAAQLPAGAGSGQAGPKALAALAEARKYLGTPYLWGGSKPSTGFDCSGLMQWAYHQAGISIGRVTTQQIHDGVAVDRSHLIPGDLVFFQDSTGYVHHVGMYIGDDKFLHAPHTGDVVKISSLSEPYYAHQFAGGRRMDASAPVGAPAGLALDSAAAAPAQAAPAAAAAAAPAAPVAGHGTGGFAALDAGRRGTPRSTVQVMQAVKAPAPAPAPAQPPAEPAASGDAAPLSADQVASAAAGGYPGDNAQPEQYAAWMAAAAQKAGLPPQLPIMAALTESGLHNLGGGDRDSVGFFQMRVGIWNQGAYAGYPQNPDLQLKWFIDQALAIKAQRLARGETAFQTDPNQWGNWIADVERPQENLRDRYQTHLAAANQLLGTG